MSNIYLKAYQWLLRAVVELLDFFPPKRIEHKELMLRKGRLPESYVPPEEGSIWVHGASLGEVITLRPFLRELAAQYGKESIVCTSTTQDGLNRLQSDEICGFSTLLPIELPVFTSSFIDRIKPRVLLISETEIWPLLLNTLKKKNIPYGIINGRINEKSVRLMRFAWPLFGSAISNMSFVFTQEKRYQRRFKILGVPVEKQEVLGSFKYDITESMPSPEAILKKAGLTENRRIILFGSTHKGEEELILEALEPLWPDLNATVIIAPRHIKRVEEIEQLLKSKKLEFQRLSEPNKFAGRIILVDSVGELRSLYAASSLAFVGGSMIERGGHNVMEPAAFACPTITGRHTFNFRSEMSALRREKAIITVNNSFELREAIRGWLLNPQDYIEMGRRSQNVLNKMSGASLRTVKKLQEIGAILPCRKTK